MLLVFKYLSQFNGILQENSNKNNTNKMSVWLKNISKLGNGRLDKAFLYKQKSVAVINNAPNKDLSNVQYNQSVHCMSNLGW